MILCIVKFLCIDILDFYQNTYIKVLLTMQLTIYWGEGNVYLKKK